MKKIVKRLREDLLKPTYAIKRASKSSPVRKPNKRPRVRSLAKTNSKKHG